jgi:hypothetical protein
LQSLTPLSLMVAELERVRSLPQVLPCLSTLTAQLAGINASLVRLPDSLGDIARLNVTLNATLATAMASIDSAEVRVG